MSNNTLLVAERSRDIGNFMVGRLLPFRRKRLVGPFCFIDHMGPSQVGPGRYVDVDQHPHIGLCTLTYLLDGSIMHRDSTGAEQEIMPGSVNLMVAGSGVTHTERTPEIIRRIGAEQHLHGYQVWIALPTAEEERSPSFHHIGSDQLPNWTEGGLQFRLVAGQGFGRQAATPTFSPLFMVDISAEQSEMLDINGQLNGEIAVVVVHGQVSVDEELVKQGQMLISKTEDHCCLQLEEGTRLLLFGGQPLPEERFLFWNFVSHSKERLERAKADWQAKRFPPVPGDETYIPLP
ncbi:MAG: pirin family protein [Bacteroidota bacterium]